MSSFRNLALLMGAFFYGLVVVLLLGIQTVSAQGDVPVFKNCFNQGLPRQVKCFDFEVPENWDKPSGRKINLHGVVIPTQGAAAAPDPLLILAGGPGQAATDYGGLVPGTFGRINQKRDIILVDQRGTGESNPLECDFPLITAARVPDQVIVSDVEKCLETFDADIRYYTSLDILKDLEYVRRTLGYEKLNLWGASFGTRLGLLYMKLYPGSIRSAILDGVTAPNSRLFVMAPKAAEDAWLKLVEDCQAAPQCQETFPDLDRSFRTLLKRLEDNPETTKVRDIWSGEWTEVVIDRDWLAEAVRTALYVPSRSSLLPLALKVAQNGDYQPLLALSQDGGFWAGQTMALGSTLAILCSEDVPRNPEAEVEAAARGTFHGDYYYRFWKLACGPVPTRDVLSGYETPVTANIPTLILSGGLDPVTPPFEGEIAYQSLPRAWHFIAKNFGHNVSPGGCGPRLIAVFVDKASAKGLDPTCLSASVRPPFLLNPLQYGLNAGAKEGGQ